MDGRSRHGGWVAVVHGCRPVCFVLRLLPLLYSSSLCNCFVNIGSTMVGNSWSCHKFVILRSFLSLIVSLSHRLFLFLSGNIENHHRNSVRIYFKDTNDPLRLSNTIVMVICCLPLRKIKFHRFGEAKTENDWEPSKDTRERFGISMSTDLPIAC